EQVPVRHAVWLDGARLRRAAGRLLRYGPLLLVPGRFLPGWRAVSSYAAGAAHMDLRAFLVYTGMGAGLWCGAWLGVGYWFGENADWLLRTANTWLALLAAAGAAAVAGLWLYRRARLD
ncbi:MAG: VTT domain-containing protein, partial [Alicyclobacillus sp.]|nr:VTT domain-containing protein [Alicyclobacillus sp.]